MSHDLTASLWTGGGPSAGQRAEAHHPAGEEREPGEVTLYHQAAAQETQGTCIVVSFSMGVVKVCDKQMCGNPCPLGFLGLCLPPYVYFVV